MRGQGLYMIRASQPKAHGSLRISCPAQ